MDRESEIQAFIDKLKKEPLVKKNLYTYTTLSGSSTKVYPIEISATDITLQWLSNKPCTKFIEKMIRENPIVSNGYFSKSDGSCPSKVWFKLNR